MLFNSTSATISDIATAGENALVSLYNGKPGETLNSVALLMYNLSHYHQHLLQPSIIHFVHIVKFNSGREQMLHQMNGGGKEVETDSFLLEQILLQLQVNFYKRCNCQSDCSTLRCTCRKHGIKCSKVVEIVKGCSCTNSETVSDDIDTDEE